MVGRLAIGVGVGATVGGPSNAQIKAPDLTESTKQPKHLFVPPMVVLHLSSIAGTRDPPTHVEKLLHDGH